MLLQVIRLLILPTLIRILTYVLTNEDESSVLPPDPTTSYDNIMWLSLPSYLVRWCASSLAGLVLSVGQWIDCYPLYFQQWHLCEHLQWDFIIKILKCETIINSQIMEQRSLTHGTLFFNRTNSYFWYFLRQILTSAHSGCQHVCRSS